MTAEEKAFWEAVAPDGQRVTIEQLYDRLDQVLTDNPDFIRLPDASSYALYSGGTDMHNAAKTLAANSNGAIGIIDDTVLGKSLGALADAALNNTKDPNLKADIIAKYGDYIDFENSDAVLGRSEFVNHAYAAFDNPSRHFASHATGNIISVSPSAYPSSAYARMELPTLLKGLDEGRIQSINGLTADVLSDAIEQARSNSFRTIDHHLNTGTERITSTEYPYNSGKASVDGQMAAQIEKVTLEGFIDDAVERVSAGQPPFTVNTPDAARPVPESDARQPAPDPDAPDTRAPPPNPDVDTPVQPVSPETPKGTGVFDDASKAAADIRAASPGANAAELAQSSASRLPMNERIDQIIDASAQGKMRAFSADPEGRSVYILDEVNDNVHFIKNGVLQNTPPLESLTDARLAFGSMLHSAGKNFPDAHNGIPRISGSIGELAEHMSSLRAPGWVRSATNVAEESGSFLGRASKILGPIGVGAAGYEVYTLESKFVDYTNMGLITPDASWAYRAILTSHAAQATLDPSLVLGEGPVQGAFEVWAHQYDINDEVKKSLRPGSLLRDVNQLGEWMSERAAEAGETVSNYVSSRADNPDLIVEDFREAGRLGAKVLGDAYDRGVKISEDLGNYANSRWDNPELILDDIVDVGEAARDGASWVWDRASGVWDSVFGDDPQPESVVLGDTPKVQLEMTLDDAALQFIMDRDAIREANGGQAGVLDSEEIVELFNNAGATGVEHVTVELSEDMTSSDRAREVLTSVNEAYQAAHAQRVVETEHQQEFEDAGAGL